MRVLVVIMMAALATLTGCASAPVTAAPEPDAARPPADSPRAQPEDAQEPIANTLRWTTASEVDNFGFDIFRAEAEEGPFTCMTEEPLLGAGTTDEPKRERILAPDSEPESERSLSGLKIRLSSPVSRPSSALRLFRAGGTGTRETSSNPI